MPSAVNFCSSEFNFYASYPEGLFVSGANANVAGDPYPVSCVLQARKNGVTMLTYSFALRRVTLRGDTFDAVHYQYGIYWFTPSSDGPLCDGETIQFRAHWTYSDASTEDTPWTIAVEFHGNGAPIPGSGGGGGHDPMLDDILASVRRVY
jgi:hypothetical protein